MSTLSATRIIRYLGQRVLRCVHCGQTNYHAETCPARLQISQRVARIVATSCPATDCGTTTAEHSAVCMAAPEMSQSVSPGAREGVW